MPKATVLPKATVIIITGAPATGKTTLGRQLTADLELPFVYKDGIKENLGDSLGTNDRDWSRQLGRATYALLEHFAETLLRANQSFILESNFHKEMALPMFQRLQQEYGFDAFQIWCQTETAVLQQRFQARTVSGTRHAIHYDSLRDNFFTPENIKNKYGFFNIKGEQIIWDTTHLATLDYATLLHKIQTSITQ